MHKYDYIDFTFGELPERFQHVFNGVLYNMRLYYNKYDDSFHIDIADENDVPIVMGEKLVYGMPLWGSINDQRLPMVELAPNDEYKNHRKVSALNFPSQVKLEFIGEIIDPDPETNADHSTLRPTEVNDNDYGNDLIR